MKALLLTLTLAVTFCTAAHSVANAAAIPSLDELAGDWMETKTLRNYPSVHNFIGGLQSSQYLTDFMHLTIYPFAQSWGSGPLLLDGQPLAATETRWYPYEVRRRTAVNGVVMESAMRMPFEQPGVLLRLTLKNNSPEIRTLNFGMKVYARIRSYAFAVSVDGKVWKTVSEGEFGNLRANPVEQTMIFAPVKAQYFKFIAKHALEKNHAVVAEIGIVE